MEHAKMPAFQIRTAAFVERNHLSAPLETRLLDLSSEVGELCKEVLKATKYGRTRFHRSEEWENELGDVMFALVCLANDTGVNLEASLSNAIHKYEQRIAEKGDAGSA